MQELIERAKELLGDGTVVRVLGWKAGDLPYNPEPAYFENEEDLKDFVYNGFCGANLSKYMIEASKKEGKTLVLCCDLTVLPLDGECSVYYDAGEGYELVRKWDGQSLTQSTEERYWFQMLDYRVFVIEISVKEDEETHAVVFVVNGEQEKVGKWEEEILSQ